MVSLALDMSWSDVVWCLFNPAESYFGGSYYCASLWPVFASGHPKEQENMFIIGIILLVLEVPSVCYVVLCVPSSSM